MENRYYAVATPRHTDPQVFLDAGCTFAGYMTDYATRDRFADKDYFIRINKKTLEILGRGSCTEGLSVLPPCYSHNGDWTSDYITLEDFLKLFDDQTFNNTLSLEEIIDL